MESIFDQSSCAYKWTREYANKYLEVCYLLKNESNKSNKVQIQLKTKETLNTFSKRLKNTTVYTNQLASNSSEHTGKFYKDVISVIKGINDIVKNHNNKKFYEIINISIKC